MIGTEKKLLQTIDMIIVKKKRLALIKRGNKTKGQNLEDCKTGWWGMLRTVTTVGRNSGESILSFVKFRKLRKPNFEISFLFSRKNYSFKNMSSFGVGLTLTYFFPFHVIFFYS